MSRKIVMTLVCILVLGLSGCGDTLTLNQYNTSEIWYIAYTDIDTVCESNELTADGSSILHSEEDYLLLSYVVDSNIEITKELKDGGWDHLILTNPQWIDRFGDPSKLKPVEYGSLANSMQEFLDVQMPILTADGNVLPDGVGLYQYDGETLLAFPVHVALGAAEPIEAKNPLIILVDKPAQSLKASSCMLPLTSSGNVLFAEGEKLQESFDESKLIDYGSIEEFQMNISCLSHDLRTPLTSIRGYLQLLSSAPDEKRAEYISALSGKALRLERLIDDFYQISLLEAGQYPFYYEKVELCSLLTEILLDNYSIFSVNGIEPQIEIPNMDIYLNADRKACIRIIQNLIFNAVTSTTNNVVIQLINIADSVQLCIKNPVASIPTEEYSKLLERFYVADVSRSNGTSGQGLYIVKKLLLMMNCTNPIIEIHDHNFMITIDFSPLLIKK